MAEQNNSVLVGLALDVSGSMRSSLQNSGAGELSRLDAIYEAVDEIIEEAIRLGNASTDEAPEPSLSLFGYVFGTRIPGHEVCDVFRALEVSLEKDRFSASEMLRALREERTIRIRELREKWSGFRKGLTSLTEYMGGSTPMLQAFQQLETRFRRESSGMLAPKRLLFVVSDGNSSDGDPVAVAASMKSMNVTIISCFVSASDAAAPRQLVSEAPGEAGARTMFEVSSPMVDGSAEEQLLTEYGWKSSGEPSRHSNTKLFSQINHSDLLKEFIHLVLTPLRTEASMSLRKTTLSRYMANTIAPKESGPVPSSKPRDPISVPTTGPEEWEPNWPDTRRDHVRQCDCCNFYLHPSEKWRDRGFCVAERILRNREDTEDAVQDAYLRLWQKHLSGSCCHHCCRCYYHCPHPHCGCHGYRKCWRGGIECRSVSAFWS